MVGHDVIICGAGPAGSTAAYHLARGGQRVLIIDRMTFPRRKACAGALTPKARKLIPFDIEHLIKASFSRMSIGNGKGAIAACCSGGRVAFMTERAELDAFLLEQAVASGAEAALGVGVRRVGHREDGVFVLLNDGSEFEARFLIGADGANSIVNRQLGLNDRRESGFAIEATVPNETDPEMLFDFGNPPGGYCWVFPKGDTLNLGVYTSRPRLAEPRTQLRELIRRVCPDGTTPVSRPIGFPVGFGGQHYHVESDRAFLVGDAAGFADMLLGEGIYYALRSGKAVADAILAEPAAAGEAYERACAPIRRDLGSCAASARWFNRFPRLGWAFLSLRSTRYALMKGFSAGLTLREVKSSPLRVVRSRHLYT